MVPHNFDLSEHHVPVGYKTNITVPVFSINGTDISSDCDYKILGKSKGISVYPYRNGIINVTCSDVGTFNFTVGTTKYERSVEANITVIAHPNLHSISLITPDEDPRVGKSTNILFRGLGPEGERLQIDDKYINWSVEGDCDYSVLTGAIEIIPRSSGVVKVLAQADIGFGPVEGNISINAGHILERARITSENDEIMNGTTHSLNLRIYTYNNLDISGYQTTWTSNENAMIESNTPDGAVIRAVGEGEVTVSANVSYFNEYVSASITLEATPAPGTIVIDKNIIQEIGNRIDYELEILTSSRDPFYGDFFITPGILDPEIASVSIEDNILTVIGDEEGETELILNLSTMEGISFESTLPVSIRSSPDRISIGNYPEYPRTGQSFQVDFSVFNYREDEVKGFSVDVKSNLTEIEIIDSNHFSIIPEKSGYDEIIITVEKYGVEIESKINFRIVPPVSEVLIEMDSFEVPVNTGNGFSLILKDPTGNVIPWIDFQFNKHQDIAIEKTDNVFILNGSRTGTFQIFYTTDYFGRTLGGSFNVTFYEISVLSEIRLTFDENSRVVEVLCLDQNSRNITLLCSIQWSGDFDTVTDYKVTSRSKNITVSVMHNGTYLKKEIDTPIDVNEGKSNNLGIILLIPTIIVILIGGVVVLIIGKKGYENQEEPNE
jgi:hypothetical protein